MKALAFAVVFSISQLAHAAPITITQGGWYMGGYSSEDSNVPAVNIQTQQPVTIYHSVISSAGVGIQCIAGANVTVLSCYGVSMYQGQGIFVQAQEVPNIQVTSCFISGWRIGVWICNPVGFNAYGANVTINFNEARNNLQFAQLVNINGASGQIAWNQDITTIPCTDQINIFATTARTPFLINDNYIAGPVGNTTQGGIVMDGAPGAGSSNVSINQNQVIGANFNGVTLAYSRNCTAASNTVITAGAVTWYGMQAYECDATNIIGPNNVVGFGPNGQNYLPNTPWGTYINNSNYGPVQISDEQLQFAIWQNKLVKNAITIGVNW